MRSTSSTKGIAGSGSSAGVHPNARDALDPRQPIACFLEEERGANGLPEMGAVILLTSRECPFHCIFCDLWRSTLPERIPEGAVPAQIDAAMQKLSLGSIPGSHPALDRLKLYNSGSFFDPAAIPPQDYSAIAERVKCFSRVIVECHPALVNESALLFQDRIAPARLEIAMGLETSNPKVLAKLGKRMTLGRFEKASSFLASHRIPVRAFTMLQPPFQPQSDEALEWSLHSVRFAFDCGASTVIVIPTRGNTPAMAKLAGYGEFVPPTLRSLEKALEQGCELRRGNVFADLWDLLKLDACSCCKSQRMERIRQMNLSQTPPQAVECGQCAADH